jgi:lysozyme family protein
MKYFLICVIICLSACLKAADFEGYFPHLIKVEGSFFTITQFDKGGATKFGVTIGSYQMYCKGQKIVIVVCDKNKDNKVDKEDLALTVLRDVKPIYKTGYWDFVHGDEIDSQPVAEMICDLYVNSGSGKDNKHIKKLQRFLGIKDDGVIGSRTIKAINRAKPRWLYEAIYNYRVGYFKSIVRHNKSQKKFLKGWLNRLKILKKTHYES